MNHVNRFSRGLRERGSVCKPNTQQHSACSSYFWAYWVHTQQTGDHLAGSPVDRHFISKADSLCTKCQPCRTFVAKFACTPSLLWEHSSNIICKSTFPPSCNFWGFAGNQLKRLMKLAFDLRQKNVLFNKGGWEWREIHWAFKLIPLSLVEFLSVEPENMSLPELHSASLAGA